MEKKLVRSYSVDYCHPHGRGDSLHIYQYGDKDKNGEALYRVYINRDCPCCDSETKKEQYDCSWGYLRFIIEDYMKRNRGKEIVIENEKGRLTF